MFSRDDLDPSTVKAVGLFLLAAVVGVFSFWPQSRTDYVASLQDCSWFGESGGRPRQSDGDIQLLTVDQPPRSVRIQYPDAVRPAIARLCQERARVRLVVQEVNRVFWVRTLEPVGGHGALPLPEADALKRAHLKRIVGRLVALLLAGLGLFSLGLLDDALERVRDWLPVRAPAPRAPARKSAPVSPPSGATPASRSLKGPGQELFMLHSEGFTFVLSGFAGAGLFFWFGYRYLVSETSNDKLLFLGLAILGLFVLLFAWTSRPYTLTAHERAVALKRWGGGGQRIVLRDEEVVEIGFQVIHQYMTLSKYGPSNDGIHAGSRTRLKLLSETGGSIDFISDKWGMDRDLNEVCERISERVKHWLHRRIDAGHEVLWGGQAVLSREGLRLLNAGASQVYPFSQLRVTAIEGEGKVLVSTAMGARLFSIDAAETNFRPCMMLIQERANAPAAQVTGA